ncbi:MAG: exodeoxyribonuclease VII small subunit [Oscillospiraceae bacterium]|nr:exodeoxyribonuclease VII small subunit [Oscillospiraceae bacterium]
MAKKTYEESVARLEEIVASLEGGELSLDESMKLFEEGTKLVSFCSTSLDKAQTKIKELTELERGADLSE